MAVIGRAGGHVVRLELHALIAALHGARSGDVVHVTTAAGRRVAGRVNGIDGSRSTIAPAGDTDGIAVGDRVELNPLALQAVLGTALFGRAVAGDGAPLDGRGGARGRSRSIVPAATLPGARSAICEPFWTGVRAIDGPLVFGRGARIGVFGGPGSGKSSLLDVIVAGSRADAVVVGLIGERGREAERWLRAAGSRTTVVCATSDRSPAERFGAAELAFAQAAALRERGLHVLLVVDSLARIAAAARDLAVAAGEPVGRGGYPASVVARQARLLESAGATPAGSVTLVATVLADGVLDDPVADAARAALDGHLVLDPRLAAAGWFPAIDQCASVSRTAADVATPAHRRAAGALRAAVAALESSRDARAVGLDPAAANPALARALAVEPRIAAFLRQDAFGSPPADTLTILMEIADSLDDGHLR